MVSALRPWSFERNRTPWKTWARPTTLFLHSKIRQRGVTSIQQAPSIFRILILVTLHSFTGIIFSMKEPCTSSPVSHPYSHKPLYKQAKRSEAVWDWQIEKKKILKRKSLMCLSLTFCHVWWISHLSSRKCYTPPHSQTSQDFCFLKWICWAK